MTRSVPAVCSEGHVTSSHNSRCPKCDEPLTEREIMKDMLDALEGIEEALQ